MNVDNIYLIGMMGSGKSTIGKLLSKKMNLEYIDMDRELEILMDMSIQRIFSDYGEKRFRMIESTFFREISKVGQLIYATGGGIILDKLNRAIIQKGTSIFLNCSIEELINRVQNDNQNRPLLNKDIKKNMINLYNERNNFYKECATHTIDTTTLNTNQVIDEIIKCIN